MKTLHLTILTMVVSILIVFSIQNVHAIPYMSPQDLYKQSDMVFYGQVVSVGPGPGPNSNYYQIKIVTNFKNPQTSDYITVEGNKMGSRIQYPQFEAGDNAVFYIQKINGINTISPYSQKAGKACDIHSFLGPAPIPGEPIMRGGYATRIYITDANGNFPEKFLADHQVILSYNDIWNSYPQARTIPIEISILDSNEKMVFYKKQGMGLRACDGPGTIQWDFVPTQAGRYSSIVIVDNKTTVSTSFDVNNSPVNSMQSILSPLKQFKSGISAIDIKCEQGLQLVIKAEDGHPACVKADTAIVLVNHRWATNVLQPNPMAGLNNYTGIATLKNQAYYFETANYTDDAYNHPVQISFHDVIFTLFPSGFRGGLPAWGCGGSYYWTDAKFSDGTSELLQIFVGDQQCFVPQPLTHFSIHENPQAGLTFYDGKMKLLVGTKNTLESSTRLNPVDVVSIQFVPTPPNPGGPTMQVTLTNIGMKPVTNLTATLALNNNYVFNFKDVTESNPLAPGHSTSDTEMLIGVGSTEMTYPLTVVGTENNETFSYTLNIHIPYTNENEIIKVRR